MRRTTVRCTAVLLVMLSVSCSSGRREIAAEFTDVGDLVTRANVQQSDAVIGSVRSIDLVDRGGLWLAKVVLRIDEDASVQTGTTAVVRSTSLLGEKYVDLVPPAVPGSELPGGAVLPAAGNAKAPELEAFLSQLGSLLASGGLEDLARITTAGAMILEGQSEDFGRVLDGTAKLIASISAQKDALAAGLADLSSASKTLAGRTETLNRALDVSDDALSIVASERGELDALVIALDKLAAPLADLTRKHQGDIDAQVKALNTIVPQLHKVRGTLEDAVEKLPAFTKLFAQAAPGDYVQLDVFLEAFPIGTPTSGGTGVMRLRGLVMEAAR